MVVEFSFPTSTYDMECLLASEEKLVRRVRVVLFSRWYTRRGGFRPPLETTSGAESPPLLPQRAMQKWGTHGRWILLLDSNVWEVRECRRSTFFRRCGRRSVNLAGRWLR